MSSYKFYQTMFSDRPEAEAALFEMWELKLSGGLTHYTTIPKDYEAAFEAYKKELEETEVISPYLKLVAEIGGNSINLSKMTASQAYTKAIEKFPDMVPEAHTPPRYKMLVEAAQPLNHLIYANLHYGSDRSKDGELMLGCSIVLRPLESYDDVYDAYLKPRYSKMGRLLHE